MPTIAIVGASTDRSKYGNKAVRAYAARGFTVCPVNPTADAIEGLAVYRSLADVPRPIDMVSFYVPPAIGETLLEAVRETGAAQFWLNPGSESDALIARARALGLEPIVACSIVAVGESPHWY
jgi:predicted CoA-binding protein